MEGIKLINASEVITSRKTSKIEIKKISKSPIKIITDDNQKNTVGGTSRDDTIVRPDTLKPDIVARPNVIKHDMVSVTDAVTEANNGNNIIRAIKLKQDIYYGPKNANKNKFVRMYKKLKLVWRTESIDGVMVDGWFNSDKSQYVIKLLEDGDFKRFKFYGCDEIYDYFVNLGGVVFDHNKEDSLSSNYNNNNINNVRSVKEGTMDVAGQSNNVNNVSNVSGVNRANGTKDADEDYKFIGADLWSGYRTRQLLKSVPDNWGVKWK